MENNTNTNNSNLKINEAKAFLLKHSRVVKAGVYFNKFNPYGVQRRDGVTVNGAQAAFQSIVETVSGEFAEQTGYTITYAKGRLILAEGGDDPIGLFNGGQMKLNGMPSETLEKHEEAVKLFDNMCERITSAYQAAIGERQAETDEGGNQAETETKATVEAPGLTAKEDAYSLTGEADGYVEDDKPFA